VVAGSKLNKVLIDGGSGLNVLFTKTLKKMKLDITHMLTKSNTPFYGILPGNAAIPLGSVVLPVTFRESRDNFRTEYIKFGAHLPEYSCSTSLGKKARTSWRRSTRSSAATTHLPARWSARPSGELSTRPQP
jgi:hypothetical protein